jgi:predicted phosphoribosyltransferase
MATRIFADRTTAGKQLARAILARNMPFPAISLGLPRGGVPIAFEIARRLEIPLDVLVVRKIGMPGQPELAIGAIAPGGVIVREPDGYPLMIDSFSFERLARSERKELERRNRVYRAGLLPLELKGKTVILADDGIATGSSMLAAIRSARVLGADRVIAASPIVSEEGAALVAAEADDLIAIRIAAQLGSVGEWYEHFEQLEDSEVCELLAASRMTSPALTSAFRETAAD